MMRALSLVAMVTPGPALAEPTYHRVTGVAATDTLNIRSAPDADSADVGDLPHDARGIEVLGTDATGDWARIGRAEGDGWVSTHFLTGDTVATLGDSSVPAGLSCGGTEPFWALALRDETAVFSHPEGGDTALALRDARVAEGFLGSPALIHLDGSAATADAVVTGAACSDGMSDRSYGWTLTLSIRVNDAARFLSGCCHLPRD